MGRGISQNLGFCRRLLMAFDVASCSTLLPGTEKKLGGPTAMSVRVEMDATPFLAPVAMVVNALQTEAFVTVSLSIKSTMTSLDHGGIARRGGELRRPPGRLLPAQDLRPQHPNPHRSPVAPRQATDRPPPRDPPEPRSLAEPPNGGV